MTKTENFQFNQWEAGDPIRREDFNRDNAILDAALGGRMGTGELVREGVLVNGGTSLSLDLTDFDWDRWGVVLIQGAPKLAASTSVSFTLNGLVGLWAMNESFTTDVPRMFVLFPMRDSSRAARALYFPGGNLMFATSTYRDITTASIGCGAAGGLAAGTSIRVYGF
jgi:hypothetical protein